MMVDFWFTWMTLQDGVVRYVPETIHVIAQARPKTLTEMEAQEVGDWQAVRMVEEKKEEKKEPILSLYFDFDSAKLRKEEKEKLKALENKSYLIVGHADWIGKEDYNYRLSQRRAKAVEKELKGLGIKDLQIEGRGETECEIKKELEGKVRITKGLIEELQPCRRVDIWER